MVTQSARDLGARLAGLLGRRHLCIDVREGGAYWALAGIHRTGQRPLQHGRLDRKPGERDAALVQRLAETNVGRSARIDLVLRSSDVEHRRLDLPPLGARELTRVAERRVADLRSGMAGTACIADSISCRTRTGSTLWLCSMSPEESNISGLGDALGARLHRLMSHTLAVGYLARILPPLPDGELTGIVDLDRESGLCVIADGKGWRFSRKIALKFAGDRRARGFAIPEETDAEPVVAERKLGWGARIRTELARTFRYVESELGVGRVSRVIVAGESPALSALVSALAAQLDLPVELLSDALVGTGMDDASSGAAVAIGLAAAPAADGGNLMPPPARQRRDEMRLRHQLAAGLAGVFCVGAVGALAIPMHLGSLERGIHDLETRWQGTASERERLARLTETRERSRALDAALAVIHRPEPHWGHLLEVLGRIAPDRLVVQQLTAGLEREVWRTTMRIEARASSIAQGAQTVVSFSRNVADSSILELDEVVRDSSADPAASADDRLGTVRFRLRGRLAPFSSGADPSQDADAGNEGRAERGIPDA